MLALLELERRRLLKELDEVLGYYRQLSYRFRLPSGKLYLPEHLITGKVYEASTGARDEVDGFCSSMMSLLILTAHPLASINFRNFCLSRAVLPQLPSHSPVFTCPSCYVKTGRTAPWGGSRLTKNLEGIPFLFTSRVTQ
jgi:hypothetical protein